jgi:3-methyladenine DNA glycosylase AlkD
VELTAHVSSALEELRDERKAVEMAAYMKTDMPFYGVQKPDRVPIIREIKKAFRPASSDEYHEGVLALWQRPYREEKYFAINYASCFPEFIVRDSFPLYERLIREGAWWDLVDGVSGELVGPAYRKDKSIRSIINKWSKDKDKWIRRTSLICQLGHKDETDHEQLFELCLKMAPEKEFFIQKAIGWALREYSKTDPRAVKSFLKKNKDLLAPLSYREGAKQLIKSGVL